MNRLLLLSIFLSISAYTFGQGIANTKWQTYNSGLSDTVNVVIETDTIYQFIHPDTLLVASWYLESNDTVTLGDAYGVLSCPPQDTGKYLYTVSNDTLTITLLSDQCIQRSMVYDGVQLWRVDKPTGVAITERKFNAIKVWPNPSSGKFTLFSSEDAQLTVFSLDGRVVLEPIQIEKDKSQELFLSSGSYILRSISPNRVQTERLIVK